MSDDATTIELTEREYQVLRHIYHEGTGETSTRWLGLMECEVVGTEPGDRGRVQARKAGRVLRAMERRGLVVKRPWRHYRGTKHAAWSWTQLGIAAYFAERKRRWAAKPEAEKEAILNEVTR